MSVTRKPVTYVDPDMPIPMTQQEETELRRVHNMLCNYVKKKELEAQIRELETINDGIQEDIMIEYADDLASIASSQRVENALAFADDRTLVKISNNESKMNELKELLIKIRNKPNQKIAAHDLMEISKDLNYPITKKQVEEMIWEVDEDLDRCLSWDEFRLMYERNITDRTGLEPSRVVSIITKLLVVI